MANPKSTLQPANQPLSQLSTAQIWENVRSLESIAFIQSSLEIILQTLWEQLTTTTRTVQAPERRIFIHLDYILSETIQEQVDTLREQIEQLWRNDNHGVIQFNYNYSFLHFALHAINS